MIEGGIGVLDPGGGALYHIGCKGVVGEEVGWSILLPHQTS